MPSMVVRPLIVVLLIVATSACAPLSTPVSSGTSEQSSQPEWESSPSPTPTPAEVPATQKIAPTQQKTNPAQTAVTSLLQEGWQYYQAENYDKTIAIAERAQRLDARRAEVYLLLASSYFAIGQDKQAAQLGQRGLSFSEGDARIRHQLRSLLANIQGTGH